MVDRNIEDGCLISDELLRRGLIKKPCNLCSGKRCLLAKKFNLRIPDNLNDLELTPKEKRHELFIAINQKYSSTANAGDAIIKRLYERGDNFADEVISRLGLR